MRVLSTGSPPQVRGKRVGLLEDLAGAEDHPRRCGENVYVFPCVRNKPGSPPQVRGKPGFCTCGAACTGITPAGAGKTACLLRLR